MRTESGFVVSEYTNGTIKKQISNKRITSFDLSKKEVEEIQKEIESLNFHHLVNEINQQEEFSQYPAVMYMYIRGNDTIKTNFFKASSIPSHAKKLDLLMTKMRSNS